MPNRILKESVCRSEEIDALSWFEEVLFYRLIVNCDDYGRFDARTKIVKSSCFPLKDVTEKDVEKALNKLSAVGLVRVYEAQGRPVLQLVTWEQHQRVRNKKSKYPGYEEKDNPLSIDSEPLTIASVIQSESESESIRNLSDFCPELNSGPQPAEEKEPAHKSDETSTAAKDQELEPVISLPLNTGEEYPVFQSDINEFAELYPAVDVLQAMRKMRGWLINNPTKRKTKRGIRRFMNHWLSEDQDRAPRKTGETQSGAPKNRNQFVNFTQRQYDYDELAKKIYGGTKE